MIKLLSLTKPEELTLRAEATKVLATLINVFTKADKNFYLKRVKPLSEKIYKQLNEIEDYEIKESSF